MSRIAAIAVLLAWVVACSDQTDVTEPERSAAPKATDATTSTAELNFKDHDFRDRDLKAAHTALSGGATTVFDYPPGEAFSQPAPNLQGANVLHHEAGDVAFELEFEDTSGLPNSGLGPVFDNVSCEECHLGDGRGRPPDDGVAFESLLFRASIAGRGA
jgi:CxxC motif-containing protein (DUF1111 family)